MVVVICIYSIVFLSLIVLTLYFYHNSKSLKIKNGEIKLGFKELIVGLISGAIVLITNRLANLILDVNYSGILDFILALLLVIAFYVFCLTVFYYVLVKQFFK